MNNKIIILTGNCKGKTLKASKDLIEWPLGQVLVLHKLPSKLSIIGVIFSFSFPNFLSNWIWMYSSNWSKNSLISWCSSVWY